MIVFKRKQLVIAVIFCMILAAGYINWAYQPDEATQPASNDETKYLGEAELVSADATDTAIEAKTTARNKAMELLNDYSYRQVSELTGISVSTLVRTKRVSVN